jgi:putative transposase
MAMSRIHRPIIANATYFVTSTTYTRKKWFAKADLAQIVADQWLYYAKSYAFRLHTYAILPDHYHVVLTVGENKTISQILHAVNSYTDTLVCRQLGLQNKVKVWAGDVWDEVIRSEQMYWQKVAYVLGNPWRAGLIGGAIEPYAFSDIAQWREQHGDEFLLNLFAEYKRWME